MIVTQNGPQNIDQVKTHFECGNLFLSPVEYQRESAWSGAQKQLLIDTIFRGMDIPKLYFWKIDEKTLAEGYPDGDAKKVYKEILERKRRENDDLAPYIFEAVDGQQRIRTILEYMGVVPPNDRCFRGVWHPSYPALAETPMARGKTYGQLNAEQKIHFGQCRLTIMVLENALIDEVRDMFLRLQNGTPLNVQQKRDAMGSRVGAKVRELVSSQFFGGSVNFGNEMGEQHRVLSQMFLLESRDKIVPCTSQQLDKFYQKHRTVDMDVDVVRRVRRVVQVLGKVFPERDPALNRSYSLGLYWALSRIFETYDIQESEYVRIRRNFQELDQARLEAMNREYVESGDDIFRELSDSMSRGTDGSERITSRYEILTQYLFDGVSLTPKKELDPKRAFTYEEKLILFRRSNGRCQLGCDGHVCGRDIPFEDGVVDHIVPHSKGGKTSLENGRYAHKLCNISRGVRDDFSPNECLIGE